MRYQVVSTKEWLKARPGLLALLTAGGPSECSNTIDSRDHATVSHRATYGAIHFLCLAATPTFAIMALLTGVHGGSPPGALCPAVHGASPLSGMVPMYLLMSAFHSVPWLRLMASRFSGAHLS
ncbi:MAG: hypothetical protein ABSA58_02070 [Acetobacteraceae bacterium]|jgi:hypothetical protein